MPVPLAGSEAPQTGPIRAEKERTANRLGSSGRIDAMKLGGSTSNTTGSFDPVEEQLRSLRGDC